MQQNFAFTAAAFEGGLVAVAIVLGWLLQKPPLATLSFNLRDTILGVVATLPPLGIFWLSIKLPLRPFQKIVQILDETLVPMFRHCGWTQLAILATLAGVGEEMLFRGIVQATAASWMGGHYGVIVGLLLAALLFGLLHYLTATYAIMAGLIALYLGGIWLAVGNLLTPMVIHGLYDFLALAYLIKRSVTQ
jgi:membrane protease YdiL (CAAX protease family)